MKLPELPGGTADGTIVEWRIAEGEGFAAGAVLVRIETETAFVDLQAATAGTLEKILAPAGATITPGTVIARMDAAAGAEPAAVTDNEKSPVQRDSEMSNETPVLPENVTPVLMPQVGNDMEEGTIVKWVVSEGDAVEKGQIIFEVETDKATIEIEADAAGRLARIVAPEGEIVPIKQPVAYLADNDADVDAYIAATKSAQPAEPAKPAPAVPATSEATETVRGVAPAAPRSSNTNAAEQVLRRAPQNTSTSASGRVKASPAARRFAAERGVNLAAIPGSGPGGRVLSTDVLAAPTTGAVAPQVDPVTPQGAALGDDEIVTELPKMRRAIARNLTASKQTVPHFYMKITIDAEPMMAFYRSQKQQYKLSVNDVIVKAVAATLSEFPAFRSRFEDTQITERPRANVGIAVGTEGGLRVPVVMSADLLSLQEVAAESRRVVENARAGKLENVGEGVFTISNLGMFGIEEFSAIINPPEAGILAVGAVREDVIVSGGAIKPTRVCTMTLSCDHRVVDGLVAAQFAVRLKDLLENPQLLMQ